MKRLLIISLFIGLLLTGCNMNKKSDKEGLQQTETTEISEEQNDIVLEDSENVNNTNNEKLNGTNEELAIETEKLQFIDLKLESEKEIFIDNENITFSLEVKDYDILAGDSNSFIVNFKYTISSFDSNKNLMGKYEGETEVYGGRLENVISSVEAIPNINKDEVNIDIAKENLLIKLGIMNDYISAQKYIVFYTQENFEPLYERFYIYTLTGNQLMNAINMGIYGNSIRDGEELKMVNAVEYYENQILVFDMYTIMGFNQDIPVWNDLERNVKEKDNVLHRITIENGNIIDDVIKTYSNIPIGMY